MADWRENILQEFVPQVASLTLVADPDGLLLEEGVLASIRDRGFDILEFEDPIEFRFVLAGKWASMHETEQARRSWLPTAGPPKSSIDFPMTFSSQDGGCILAWASCFRT